MMIDGDRKLMAAPWRVGSFLAWVMLAGLLQVTLFTDVNLLVILSVFTGLRKGALAGLWIGGVIGIFAAIFSASPFLSNILPYGMVGFLSGFARAHIYYKENILVQIMFSFCGMLLFYLAYFALTASIQPAFVPTVIFSAAASPLIFRMLD